LLSAFSTVGNVNANNNKKSKQNTSNNFSLLHINSRSISKNFDSVATLLHTLHNFSFSIIGITETWLHANSPDVFNIQDYNMLHADRKEGRGGGVALYIHTDITHYRLRKDIHIQGIEDIFIEIQNNSGKNILVGTLYRPPSNDVTIFLENIDKSLQELSRENKHIYLMGDYNIDLTHSINFSNNPSNRNTDQSNHISTDMKFLNILSMNSFFPCINKPTRITPTSATLIDNIFTNTFDKEIYGGILYYDISDHLPIFTISSQFKSKNDTKPKTIRYRKENFENVTALNKDLVEEKWLDVYEESDVDKAYDKFMNKLNYYYDKNIPLVQIKPGKHQIRNPWITRGILNSINTRNKLYKSYLCKPNKQNQDTYKKFRNTLTNIIRNSKTMYYSQKLKDTEGDIKSTWKVINKIINKNKPKDKINSININNQQSTNPSDIANAFNSFFTSIGPDLASKIHCDNLHFSRYLSRPLTKTIFLNPTTQNEIINTTKAFKSKTSTGYDGISMKLLKQIIFSIAPPLEYIINLSLLNGTCPNLLKIAKVIPIHKKDDKTEITNYRPISLLPSVSKILEKIVYKRLISFLTINNILNRSQFGFRKNCSTDIAIIQLLDQITELLSHKEHVIAIFMDLSKAFVTIDHDNLLYKLENYGIRGKALSWLKSYLYDRQQYVCVNGKNSSMRNIQCGVPQGSILGPLLFLIYVNDIINSSSILKFTMFADDTTVLASHMNLDNLTDILNSEITKISSWFKCNKLSLNISKTNCMHFQSSHNNEGLLHRDIFIDGLPLDKKDHTKFLGIIIDKHLTWNDHTINVSSQIAKGTGILYRLRHILPQKSLLILYNTLILPYISYCNIAWGNCSKTNLDHILRLQKKAVRLCTKSAHLTHTDPLFHQLKVLKIYDINVLQTAIFVFRYTNNLLPQVFNNFFSFNRDVHSYPTRNRDNIHLNNPRILLAHKSLKHHGPDIWNALPLYVKDSPFLKPFKRKI